MYRIKAVRLYLPFPKLTGGLVKLLKLAHRHGDRMTLLSLEGAYPGDMLLKRYKEAMKKAGGVVFW